ncbi:hypothetical protein LCGC14_0914200 [marine sediment metagenome]|uniref:Uncharacterized protein n=1 Tax=marine sediment metagenome TaxID=412755 RepID=A0A0F9PDG2_9ZZZZ
MLHMINGSPLNLSTKKPRRKRLSMLAVPTYRDIGGPQVIEVWGESASAAKKYPFVVGMTVYIDEEPWVITHPPA